MKKVEVKREWGTVIVEECSRKEFLELAAEAVDYMEFADSLGIATDQTVYIEYRNGSTLYASDYYGVQGRLMKKSMVFGLIDNGTTYQVFGEYTVNDDLILESAN